MFIEYIEKSALIAPVQNYAFKENWKSTGSVGYAIAASGI